MHCRDRDRGAMEAAGSYEGEGYRVCAPDRRRDSAAGVAHGAAPCALPRR
jgi:hypothetical protein